MKRITWRGRTLAVATVGLAVGLVGAAFAASAAGSSIPGGPAPKALLGTWRTTLTAADLGRLKAPNPARSYRILFVNGPYLSYPRALGFGPVGSGGDTVPFGVRGHRLYLACLTNGTPSAGYATYTWSIARGALRFKRVREPCREPLLRDRIVILTSHAWHRR